MSRYEWIIFDADGTLFDFEQAEKSALTGTFRQYGLEFNAWIHQHYIDINARLWQEFELGLVSSKALRVKRFEELAGIACLDIPASAFSDDYLVNLGKQRDLMPGAEGVLDRLSKQARLVVATNGIADVQRNRLEHSPIRKYVDYLVISEEIGCAKPDPRYFQHVFERMGNPDKSRVLMVGDGLSSDIAGAAGFGIDTCWFNPGTRRNPTATEPTHEIRNLTELIDIYILS